MQMKKIVSSFKPLQTFITKNGDISVCRKTHFLSVDPDPFFPRKVLSSKFKTLTNLTFSFLKNAICATDGPIVILCQYGDLL